MVEISPAETPSRHEKARVLFEEYVESLGFGLDFQHWKEEMATFPAQYQPPGGALFLALAEGRAVGCVGVRRFDGEVCEMKRLYVRPAHRGRGLGRRLAQAAVDGARALGYGSMRLDTVAAMTEANALYLSMGFRIIDAYRYNPLEDAVFMELTLD